MRTHTPQSLAAIAPDDHFRGDVNAPVMLLEYGDYQCSHCDEAYYSVRSLQNALGENLSFVFRNFPLRTVHPNAQNAAEAAEATATAGRFWEMHDLLFENQESLEDEDLLEYGARLGMDPERLREDLATHRYYPRVQSDLIGGMRSGVNGTPTFFINGVRHNDDYQFETLLDAIMAVGHVRPV